MGAELQARPVPSWETFGGLISQGVAMGEMRELRQEGRRQLPGRVRRRCPVMKLGASLGRAGRRKAPLTPSGRLEGRQLCGVQGRSPLDIRTWETSAWYVSQAMRWHVASLEGRGQRPRRTV